MSPSQNRSKPRYDALEPDLGGRHHLLIGQGSGGEALLRLALKMPQDARIHVTYCAEPSRETDWSDALLAIGLCDLHILRTEAEALADLDDVLSKSGMGTRLYIAGPESFTGAALQVAVSYNLNSDEVQSEHCGSAARRVYCVHCGATQETVTTNLVKCVGCGATLLVRDHYSRRLAAYMGVMADAESPGNLPPLRPLDE
jgi:ferredoxin-NADP reductase